MSEKQQHRQKGERRVWITQKKINIPNTTSAISQRMNELKNEKFYIAAMCVIFSSLRTLSDCTKFWFIEPLLLLNLNGTESEHERKNLSE